VLARRGPAVSAFRKGIRDFPSFMQQQILHSSFLLGEVMSTGLHHKYPLSRPPSQALLLFYAYRPVLQTSSAADEAKSQLSKCVELGLSGRLLVADEGLNGTVGGDALACEAYVQWMCQVRFHGLFSFSVNHT
jgi:hypothetical protein